MGRKVILDDAEQGVPTQDLNAPTGSIWEVEEAIAVNENDPGAGNEHPHADGEDEDVEMANDDGPEAVADTEINAPSKRERTASASPAPKKRRRSGNAKPSVVEESTPSRPALTRRSQVEVVMPPHPEYVPPRKDSVPTKVKKSASRKLVASESPISTRKSSPVKLKTPARKPVSVVEEEEEEPASIKRTIPKKTQKKRRDESESEEDHESPEKPTPGPSNMKSGQVTRTTRRPPQESSPPPAHLDDAPSRGRRSAAQKADEKLKDIMPDVINFQKEMKRGAVVSGWEKAEKEQERADKKTKEEKSKENARDKTKGTTKGRRSDARYNSDLLFSQPVAYCFDCSLKEEEDGEDDEPRNSKPAGDEVHIMTTKVQIPEDTKKVRSISRPTSHRCSTLPQALVKLGAKFTEKPLECTHLIAVAFGRTEKLLSSIAVAPFILREEWLTKSAAKGRFLRKSFFPLRVLFPQPVPH